MGWGELHLVGLVGLRLAAFLLPMNRSSHIESILQARIANFATFTRNPFNFKGSLSAPNAITRQLEPLQKQGRCAGCFFLAGWDTLSNSRVHSQSRKP